MEAWLKEGVIQPSRSEYTSPLVLVPKKDGTIRVCVDYRRLNKKIIKDRYPMPVMEEQLDKLSNSRVYSTLDLKNGFFHVPVEAESIKYTSFVTHNGQYEFLRTPFGLCLSPASFGRFISEVFHNLIQDGYLMAYVDDLIIPSKDVEEGIEKLKKVLKVAADHGVIINWKKCQFLQSKGEYLGHIIKENTLKPSGKKVEAVKKFPVPSSTQDIQRFVGLANQFRKFVPNFLFLAKPLTNLLKKDVKFVFELVHRRCFEEFKRLLTTEPVLQIFNEHAETELHTDASKDGFGAVLLQKGDDNQFHPVYYMSKSTSDTEKKYSSYHLEVLAVVNAVKRLRVYLLGIPFKIVTDCSAFERTLKKDDIPPLIARWAMVLEEFDYNIEHRSKERMRHADALSRAPVMLVRDHVIDVLRIKQTEDEQCRSIATILEIQPYQDFIIQDGILKKFMDGRHVIFVPESFQQNIIRQVHDNGHFGKKSKK